MTNTNIAMKITYETYQVYKDVMDSVGCIALELEDVRNHYLVTDPIDVPNNTAWMTEERFNSVWKFDTEEVLHKFTPVTPR